MIMVFAKLLILCLMLVLQLRAGDRQVCDKTGTYWVDVRGRRIEVTPVAKAKSKAVPNYGLDTTKMSKTEKVSYGSDAPRDIPDDAKKPFVTVIGDNGTVHKDVASNPRLAAAVSDTRYQEYKPSDWAVKDGFSPGIYMQAPNGKEMWHMDTYPGATVLAEKIEGGVRRVNHKEPENDDMTISVPMLILAAIIGYFIWRRKNEPGNS